MINFVHKVHGVKHAQSQHNRQTSKGNEDDRVVDEFLPQVHDIVSFRLDAVSLKEHRRLKPDLDQALSAVIAVLQQGLIQIKQKLPAGRSGHR